MQLLDEIKQNSYVEILEKLRKNSSELIFEKIPIKGYELVLKVTHKKAKLKAIIAIHDTTLGPAIGGTRICSYQNFEEALDDVLRLSKGMTYKSALAGVGLGGGKSVIITDPSEKSEEMLMAFGEAVNALHGCYICAEDMGCDVNDVKIFRRKTMFVTGLDEKDSSGDPSPFTAWGTFLGIQSAVERVYNSKCLLGKKVAIQGLGHVGMELARNLFWAGADLIVSDLNEKVLQEASKKFNAQVVPVDKIMEVPCDVFSPCAAGGILNSSNISKLRCKIVAGAANNQLFDEESAEDMMDRKILYAPDFVINAGGLMNVATEIEVDGYNPKVPRDSLYEIYDRLKAIYEISEKNHISTNAAAISLAQYRIKYEVCKRLFQPVFHHGK